MLPEREVPLSTGWYACKLRVDEARVTNIVVACALQIKDVEDDGQCEAVAINSMRWCRGLPLSERSARCFGHLADSYTIVLPNTDTSHQPPEPNTKPDTKPEPPVVKKERIPPRKATKSKKPPFAVTDPQRECSSPWVKR